MTAPSPTEPQERPDGLLARLDWFKDLARRVLEAGLLLIGLIVLVYLLLGAGAGPYVQGVIANIAVLVAALTPQALIGVAIVVAVTQILRRR